MKFLVTASSKPLGCCGVCPICSQYYRLFDGLNDAYRYADALAFQTVSSAGTANKPALVSKSIHSLPPSGTIIYEIRIKHQLAPFSLVQSIYIRCLIPIPSSSVSK